MSFLAVMDEGQKSNSHGQRPPVFQLNAGEGLRFFLYDDHLRYGEQIMPFREMTAVSYHITSGSLGSYAVHILPASLYRLRFASLTDTIVVELHPFESVSNEKEQHEIEELMGMLYQRIHQLVKPYVVLHQLIHYWSTQSLSICNVELSSRGITTRNVWGEAITLEWSRYEKAEFRDNNLYLIRNEGDSAGGEFFFCSTDELNALVFPDILNYLKQAGGQIDLASRDKIAARLAEMP